MSTPATAETTIWVISPAQIRDKKAVCEGQVLDLLAHLGSLAAQADENSLEYGALVRLQRELDRVAAVATADFASCRRRSGGILNAALRTSADGRLLSSPRYFTATEAHERAAAFVASQPANGPAIALVNVYGEAVEYRWCSGSVVNGACTWAPGEEGCRG